MTRWYLDTSAAMKLIADENESDLAAAIDDATPDLVAGLLLETELRRAVPRDDALSQEAISTFLTGVSLFEMPPSLYREAGLLPGANLRSLDALHLAASIRIDVETVLTYDARMACAAREVGLTVLAPT